MNLNGNGILKRVELVNRHSDNDIGFAYQEEAISVPTGDILKYNLIWKFIKMIVNIGENMPLLLESVTCIDFFFLSLF